MPKSIESIYNLIESDFRKIQKLLIKKYGTAYTVGYIRKVCKGKRNNPEIQSMAEKYSEIITEMERKINQLGE